MNTIFFCRNIDAALQSVPSAIAVITLDIGTCHIEGHLPGLLMLEMKVPCQGDDYSTCPAYAQNSTVKTDSG